MGVKETFKGASVGRDEDDLAARIGILRDPIGHVVVPAGLSPHRIFSNRGAVGFDPKGSSFDHQFVSNRAEEVWMFRRICVAKFHPRERESEFFTVRNIHFHVRAGQLCPMQCITSVDRG